MIHAFLLTVTIEEGMMISSWRKIWEITVGNGVLIWVSVVYLFLTLTLLLHNPLPMNQLLVYSSAIFLKR